MTAIFWIIIVYSIYILTLFVFIDKCIKNYLKNIVMNIYTYNFIKQGFDNDEMILLLLDTNNDIAPFNTNKQAE